MSHLHDAEIQKLAVLARLKVNEAELLSLKEDLDEILGYVEKLGRCDVTGATEVNGGGTGVNAFRADVERPSAPAVRAALIAGLPAAEAGLVKVPPVFGGAK